MKIIDKNTPLYNRRVILIDEEKNNPTIDVQKLVKDTLLHVGVPIMKYLKDKESYLLTSTGFGEIDYCSNNFSFPPQHPQKGIVYSCPDFEPNFYIPLSNFHPHSLKLKESAFIEMCAHLGAKEIILTEEIIDDIKVKLNSKADNIPSQYGSLTGNVNAGYDKNGIDAHNVRFTFPRPIKHNETPYECKWIETEPTWRTLQKVRLENKVLEYSAGLSYQDDMGVNVDLAGKINKLGLSIGGDFRKFEKIERTYKVIFWGSLE